MIKYKVGTVTEIVESASMEVSYVCEDLIFIEQKGFLLQFTDSEQEVLIHMNEDVEESELAPSLALLQKKAVERSMMFNTGSYFRLSHEENSLRIKFL